MHVTLILKRQFICGCYFTESEIIIILYSAAFEKKLFPKEKIL